MLRDWLVLAFAMTVPSVMTWVEFTVLPGDGDQTSPMLQWFFALAKILQFAFPVLYVWLTDRSEVRFDKPNTRGLGVAAALGLVVSVGALILHFAWLKHTSLMSASGDKLFRWLADYRLATPTGYLLMAVLMAVLHAGLEEYYWRWFVFGWLKRYVPLPWAIGISAAGFMAHHVVILSIYLEGYFWEGVVPFSLLTAIGGAIWAWLYHRSQSLYCVWLSHGLVDFSLMMVGFDLLAGRWA